MIQACRIRRIQENFEPSNNQANIFMLNGYLDFKLTKTSKNPHLLTRFKINSFEAEEF